MLHYSFKDYHFLFFKSISPCLQLHIASIGGNHHETSAVKRLALGVLKTFHGYRVAVIHSHYASAFHLKEYLVFRAGTEVAVLIYHLYSDEGKALAFWIVLKTLAV